VKKKTPIFDSFFDHVEQHKIILNETQQQSIDQEKKIIEEQLKIIEQIMQEMGNLDFSKPKYTKEEMNELKKTELYKLVKEDL
jgi:hypothetical protein